MINLEHEAWPDLRHEREAIQLVDQRLNEALGAVAIKHPGLITPREHEALDMIGQYDTHRIAAEHIGTTFKSIDSHLREVRSRMLRDNGYVRLFTVSTSSLVYGSRHEGILDYKLDEDWSGRLTRNQAIALKVIALNAQEKDLKVFKHRTGGLWWTRSIQTEIAEQLGVPKAGPARTVGRAFEVGLFTSKKRESPEPN